MKCFTKTGFQTFRKTGCYYVETTLKLSKMKPKIKAGQVRFRTEDYIVWWYPDTKKITVSKPDDDLFGESNYGNCTAESAEEALEAAPRMLGSVFAVG